MGNSHDIPTRRGSYIAATAEELATAGAGRRVGAVFNQRVLFPHRGQAELTADGLVLEHWEGRDDKLIEAAGVARVQRRFTSRYGRFLGGGSAEWGAPVIITETSGAEIYLLFDHHAFLEKSSNVDWHLDLITWLERAG